MMNFGFWGKTGLASFQTGPWAWVLAPLVIWSLIWKGLALWRAARANQTAWYVTILILNTLGILEIVYILFFAKTKLTLSGPRSSRKR